MTHLKEKIYYYNSKLDDSVRTKETFIDTQVYNWTEIVENNYSVILNELNTHFESHEQYFYPYPVNDLVNASGKWRSFGFYFWGLRADDKICNDFSQTINILKTIPGIVSASVSMMEPGAEIKAHYGDTNAIHRCHLGLIIPAQLPLTGFQVGYEKRSWETGKLLIFNDGAYHKGWNHSGEQRMILIFDVIRPQFLKQKSWICARVNSILFTQGLIQKKPHVFYFLKFNFPQYLLSFVMFFYLKIIMRNRLWLSR